MDEGEKLPTGGLFRLQPNLAWHKMIDGIICSNALCSSPDSRVKYHADSGQRTVWAWDFNPATGDIDKRRRFRPDRHRGRRSRRRHCRQRGVRVDPTGEAGASPATIPPVASTGRSCCRLLSLSDVRRPLPRHHICHFGRDRTQRGDARDAAAGRAPLRDQRRGQEAARGALQRLDAGWAMSSIGLHESRARSIPALCPSRSMPR